MHWNMGYNKRVDRAQTQIRALSPLERPEADPEANIQVQSHYWQVAGGGGSGEQRLL